jgi:hypothetical protein
MPTANVDANANDTNANANDTNTSTNDANANGPMPTPSTHIQPREPLLAGGIVRCFSFLCFFFHFISFRFVFLFISFHFSLLFSFRFSFLVNSVCI